MVKSFVKNGEKITSDKLNNQKSGAINTAFIPSNQDVYSISRQLSNTDLPNAESTNNLIQNRNLSSSPIGTHSIILEQQQNPNNQNKFKNVIQETNRKWINKPKAIIPLIILSILISIGAISGIVYAIVSSTSGGDSNSVITKKPYSTNSETSTTSTQYNLFTSTITLPEEKRNENQTFPKICGMPKYPPNLQLTRIMKGYEALPHSWPWTVSIGYYGSRTSLPHACGGSLVNKRFVITATHCVQSSSIYSLVGSPVPDSALYGSLEKMMRIYVGVTTRSKDINDQNTYRVAEIITYPNFDPSTFKNDLALLKLDRDVQETDELNYICITSETNTRPGTDLYAVGWGFTENNFYRASDTLNQVKFQVQSTDTCGLVYLPVLQFCAGNPSLGKDTCNGDSGGPVMQMDKENRWSLVGVVSNGDAFCTGRGVYTNISYFYDWIVDNTRLS